MKSRDPALHAGHRKRMKSAFLKNGLSQFNEHQKLELILFYALPRGDTNELAHTLLNECGGHLSDVLDAPISKLTSVKGISEHTAILLKMLPAIASDYLSSKKLYKGLYVPTDMESVCSYFDSVFLNIKTEEIHAAAVSADMRLMFEEKIANGDISNIPVSSKALLDFAINNKCDRVIIAHNHPNGACIASLDDYNVTKQLIEQFAVFGIEITDHIIVGTNGSMSMRASFSARELWEEQ